MKRLLTSIRHVGTLLLVLASYDVGFAQNLILQWVNVDSSGTMIQLGYDNTVTGLEVNAAVSLSYTSFLGGVFNKVLTQYASGTQPIIARYVNGANGTWVAVNGLNYPTGLTANNIVKLVRNQSGGYYTASALTAGGSGGNGVNARVRALAMSSNGDCYAGGDFTAAGSFPYSSGIGVYRASGGWENTYIFSAFDVVSSLTWVTYPNKLKVYGQVGTKVLWQVDGPIYSFDHNSDHINVSGDTAYWNTYTGGAFDGGYWSAQ